MNKYYFCGVLVFGLIIGEQAYAELKDPRLRNEEISDTLVSVDVVETGELYKYIYTIKSPASNKGIINDFVIDLSCDVKFDEVEIPIEGRRLGYIGDNSADGKHVPVEMFSGYGTSNVYGISKNNKALWNIYLKPSETVTNISFISPARPGKRDYKLIPYMDVAGYDYNRYDEDDPSVPWIGDFTVKGKISAPSCPE